MFIKICILEALADGATSDKDDIEGERLGKCKNVFSISISTV